MKKLLLSAALILLGASLAVAQSTAQSTAQTEAEAARAAVAQAEPHFEGRLRLDVRFDNREKDALDIPAVPSQTLFPVRLVPVAGMGLFDTRGGHHSVMLGASTILDMGIGLKSYRPVEPVVYYNYDSPLYSIYAGKFERVDLIGEYPRPMWMMAFFDNIVDGFALQYHAAQGFAEAVLDWDGMGTRTQRESFRVNSYGEYNPVNNPSLKWLWAGYSLDFYHLSSRTGAGDGVVDHVMAHPWVGAHLEHFVPWFDLLTVQAGWLQAFDRDRKIGFEGEPLSPNQKAPWFRAGGVTVEIALERRNVGIRNLFYTGDVQMPLHGLYGSTLYKGDPMYSAVPTNSYLQIYWTPSLGRGVDLNLEAAFQTDGRKLGSQQLFVVGIELDNDFFGRK
ncbi:MAG: hypothetical protein LBU97_03565 [Alistipes sp.]|jgi:hypothetical protein|nr:hypothetical protein [Alistipes sp.]